MNNRLLIVIVLIFQFASSSATATSDGSDLVLQEIIDALKLRPLPTKPYEETDKYRLGQALFFDPILSGNRDISCATCHLLSHGLSDALPRSIGTGATGLAQQRVLPSSRLQQARNALDLWNRDNNWVTSMFWDGRVEVTDPASRTFRSPLGDRLPLGLDNLMAVQALFPIAQDDEMLGVPGDRSSDQLPRIHASLPNELATETAHLDPVARTKRVHELVMDRLIGNDEKRLTEWQPIYRQLFSNAFPNRDADGFSIVEIANALSHFEEMAFATRETPWDAYIEGDQEAISGNAKEGALIFFGKGRCYVCHEGPLFSDFEFHSIGVPSSRWSNSLNLADTGRFQATGNRSDLYKFRTPPLRNVTLTAPYFHDGSVWSLRDAIEQHLNPYQYADKYHESGAHLMDAAEIDAISQILITIAPLSEDEVASLISFLGALEDNAQSRWADIIPGSVPSGLPVVRLPEP